LALPSRIGLAIGWLLCCHAWAQEGGLASTNTPHGHRPITSGERLRLYLKNTAGPTGALQTAFGCGLQTVRNRPEEWDRSWKGWAHRIGYRYSLVAISNTAELGVGWMLGEDPRYFRSVDPGKFARFQHALVSTFVVRKANGRRAPAIGRLVGITGGGFIANTWYAPAENRPSDVLLRIGTEIGWNMGFHVVREFWPEIRKALRR